MSKKNKIIVNVLYYILTFAMGVLLAVVLPNMYVYDMTMTTIKDSLDNGQYERAMALVGGYYNSQCIYQKDFDNGGGIVIFEATTLVYNTGEKDDDTVDGSKLQKSYAGYIYGVREQYNIFSNVDNKAILNVTNKSNEVISYKLLDYDSDGDEKIDTVSTFYEKGFIYFDISQDKYQSISKLSFLDKDGSAFQEIELDLSYSESFFTDVNDFVVEYNKDFKSEKLIQLDKEFLNKNENYKKSYQGDIYSSAMKSAVKIVLIYFAVIYLCGDTLIGKHYLIRLFKFILVKVFKVKFKEKKRDDSDVKFGNDYYSQVTMTLDISEVEDFREPVTIRYQENDQTIEFVLLKHENYTCTKRIKAGLYPNLWVEVNNDYKLTNLPTNLRVEGYKMNVNAKIIRK